MSVGGGYNPQHPHLTPTPLHHFVFCWSNKNNNSNHDSRPDKWVPNMSAVNKSGKLNVNLYNFVPFVGGFSSAQFSSQIVRIPRKSGKMPDLQLIIAVGFAFFNVYLFAFQMPYGWTTIAGRQRGARVCPILGLISRWTRPHHRVLGGEDEGSPACWFIVCRMILHLNCLQNVWQGSNTTFEWGFLMSSHACAYVVSGF